MADQKISELTNITGANLADADEFVVVDVSADQTKAVTRAEFFKDTPLIAVGPSGTEGGEIQFADTSGSFSWFVDVGGNDAFRIRHSTAPSAFHIADSGNVSMSDRLNVSGALNAVGNLGLSNAINYNGNSVFYIRSRKDGGIVQIGTETSASTLYYPIVIHGASEYTQFNTPTSEAMRIIADGSVGIGTSSPTAKLHVSDTSAANELPDLKVSSYKPNIVLEDLSTSTTNDFQMHAEGGLYSLRHGNASTTSKLTNTAYSYNVGNGRSLFPAGLLGVGTDVSPSLSALSGAIAIGDADTGIAQNGDGVLELWANNASRLKVQPTGVTVTPNLNVNASLVMTGNIYRATDTGGLGIYGGTSGNGAYWQLFGGTHPSLPDQSLLYTSRLRIREHGTSNNFIDMDASIDRITMNSKVVIDNQLILGPVDGEGGEMHWENSAGASTYQMDVNSSGGLRLRSGSEVVMFTTGTTLELLTSSVPRELRVGPVASSFPANDSTGEGFAMQANDGRVGFIAESFAAVNIGRHTTTGSAVEFFYSGANIGSISVTGSATAYNTSSDYRLKENITPVQNATDIVKAMQPVTYTFKSDGSWHDGFLAHELQELHPRSVTGSKDAMQDEEYEVTPAVYEDVLIPAVEAVEEVFAVYDEAGVLVSDPIEGVKARPERTEQQLVSEAVVATRSVPDYQGVDYSKLTPILTAALKEALNKIDALEARLTTLEAV